MEEVGIGGQSRPEGPRERFTSATAMPGVSRTWEVAGNGRGAVAQAVSHAERAPVAWARLGPPRALTLTST